MKRLTRKDLEQARNMARLEALFFWQLAERTETISGKLKWEGRGNRSAGAALRLEQELNDPGPEDEEGKP